jgi:hypothetical protein
VGLHLRRLFGLVWEEVCHHSTSERLRQQGHCALSDAERYLWYCLLPAEWLSSGPRKQSRDGYIGAARFSSRNRMLGRWQRVNWDVRNHCYSHRSSSSHSLASTTRASLGRLAMSYPMWTVCRLAVAMLHRKIVRASNASQLRRPCKNHNSANRSAADYLLPREHMCLGKSFHSFPLNLFVCNNARDHPMHHRALREISNSPHVIALIPHGTHRLVESAPSTGVKQCHGPPCSAVAFSRLNAKCSPSAVPSN